VTCVTASSPVWLWFHHCKAVLRGRHLERQSCISGVSTPGATAPLPMQQCSVLRDSLKTRSSNSEFARQVPYTVYLQLGPHYSVLAARAPGIWTAGCYARQAVQHNVAPTWSTVGQGHTTQTTHKQASSFGLPTIHSGSITAHQLLVGSVLQPQQAGAGGSTDTCNGMYLRAASSPPQPHQPHASVATGTEQRALRVTTISSLHVQAHTKSRLC